MKVLKIIKDCLPDLVTMANKILDLVIEEKKKDKDEKTEKSTQ